MNSSTRRQFASAIAAACVVGGAACNVPTALPLWDTLWEVTVVSDTVATARLLPDGLSATVEGFALETFDSESSVTLGEVCELCTCFDGPIPELEIAEADFPIRLPSGVLSAQIVRGTAEVVIHNEVGFDVLDDGKGNRGFIQVDLADSFTDEVLESVRLDEPFPPGDSIELTFDIPQVDLSSRYVARVSGRTPGSGCDSVPLLPESGFRSRVRLEGVVASGATVIVSDTDLAIPPRDFELPSWLVDRLRPEDAEVALEVDVESRMPVQYELNVSAARTSDRLFTEESALFTPLVLTNSDPGFTSKSFLLDLENLRDADHLFFATTSRVLGSRVVTLDGSERVEYDVRVVARIPTR